MSADNRARLKEWLASGQVQLHPLTFPQRELWETSIIPPGDPANHICCLISVRGLLVPRDCEAAVRRVVERQEALRLSFLPGKQQPLQMVRRNSDPNLQFRDLSPAEGHPEAIEEIAREIFREPFDLVQGPLYRAVILRRGPDDFVFVFVIHHAVADGWTLGVFVQDLFGSYLQQMMNVLEPLPAVPLTYTAWGAAERAFWKPSEFASRTAFWKSRLDGAPRLWTPPATRTELSRRATYLPPAVAAAARALATQHGATLFSALLTAFQIALGKWLGADDFVVGTPVANRAKPAVRETMGYCAGVVPLRLRLDRTRTFSENLREIHRNTVDCFANAMPFVELVGTLVPSAPSGDHPVFQVRFALQNHPVPDVSLPTLSARLQMRSTGTARFDLGCEVTEQQDALELVWLHRVGMFSPADLEELDRLFQATLAGACQSPESRTAALTC